MSTQTEEVKLNPQQYAVFSEPLQIAEDVTCCLKVNAVIAKEGVYSFPAGPNGENKQCLWSRIELQKATRTARAAKIVIKEHPPGKVVTSQDEIYGTVEQPFFDRDRIRAVLSFDKDITPADFLEGIRGAASKEGKPQDVSIGFYYSEDNKPGIWHGQQYDMAMRNIVIDHVATGVWKGRCTYPNCGIGVSSEEVKMIAAASFKKMMPEEKKEETAQAVLPPVAVEAPKVTDPKIEAPSIKIDSPTITTPKFVSPPKPEKTTQELIDWINNLSNIREQRKIERFKAQQRHPA
jgi:hypothetical protein